MAGIDLGQTREKSYFFNLLYELCSFVIERETPRALHHLFLFDDALPPLLHRRPLP